MRLILLSLYKTIATGSGSIVHVDGGLLRYHVEEHLANKIDDDIKRVFKVDLRQAYQAKTNETHFLVYYRNAIFYYERFLFFAWNVFGLITETVADQPKFIHSHHSLIK